MSKYSITTRNLNQPIGVNNVRIFDENGVYLQDFAPTEIVIVYNKSNDHVPQLTWTYLDNESTITEEVIDLERLDVEIWGLNSDWYLYSYYELDNPEKTAVEVRYKAGVSNSKPDRVVITLTTEDSQLELKSSL